MFSSLCLFIEHQRIWEPSNARKRIGANDTGRNIYCLAYDSSSLFSHVLYWHFACHPLRVFYHSWWDIERMNHRIYTNHAKRLRPNHKHHNPTIILLWNAHSVNHFVIFLTSFSSLFFNVPFCFFSINVFFIINLWIFS